MRNAGSADIVAGCYAWNIRAIKAHISQLAIAELGQHSDIALTVPERLDHADERKQHLCFPCKSTQLLENAFFQRMQLKTIAISGSIGRW